MAEPELTTVPRDLYYHEVAYVRSLEAALRSSQCPRPANAVPERIISLTVEECMGRGECGCDSGAALRKARL